MSFGSGFGPGSGQPGAPGTNGADGNTVLYAPGAPLNVYGVDGNFYIDTATNYIYGPKAGGVWPAGTSLVGPTGAAGSNGTNGNTVLTTSGAPSNATGANGDFAYDPAATIMYGPKAGGVWPSGVSLGSAHNTQINAVDITTSSAAESTVVSGTFVATSTAITYSAFLAFSLIAQQNCQVWLEIVGVRRIIAVAHFHTTASATRGMAAWPVQRVSGLTIGQTYTIRIRWQASSGTRGMASGNEEAGWINVRND